tara:strand:+ start:517 stop:678 length:162 start_codon:yes stop_codon:yes gene_type:complete
MKLFDETLPLNKVLSELKQYWLERLQRRKIKKQDSSQKLASIQGCFLCYQHRD